MLLLSVLAVGMVFAQSAPLRQGVYQARGYADEVWVRANADYNPQSGWYQRTGYYLIASFIGSCKDSRNQWCVDAGPVRGNEIHTNVVWINPPVAAQEGVVMGEFEVYTIINSESFKNSKGVVWVWRRADR